ncbi:MAG: hypothetical protein WBX00_19125 [Isosphaeraceae bacterium]
MPRGFLTISDGLVDRESRGPSGPGAIVVDLDLERIDGEPRIVQGSEAPIG